MSKTCICGTEISENQVYCPCCKAVVRYSDLPGHPSLCQHLIVAHHSDVVLDDGERFEGQPRHPAEYGDS